MKSYTTKTIEDAGRLLSDASIDTMTALLQKELVYRAHFKFEPRTYSRRQRLRWRLETFGYRLETAIDVLRGRHECDDY